MVISGETLAAAGALATLGGIGVAAIKNIGSGITWWEARRERLREDRVEARNDDLAWAQENVDALRRTLTEQRDLADQALDAARAHRETIGVLTVWVRAAAWILLTNKLAHLIGPPPGWTGDDPWPTEPPHNSSSTAPAQPPASPPTSTTPTPPTSPPS